MLQQTRIVLSLSKVQLAGVHRQNMYCSGSDRTGAKNRAGGRRICERKVGLRNACVHQPALHGILRFTGSTGVFCSPPSSPGCSPWQQPWMTRGYLIRAEDLDFKALRLRVPPSLLLPSTATVVSVTLVTQRRRRRRVELVSDMNT